MRNNIRLQNTMVMVISIIIISAIIVLGVVFSIKEVKVEVKNANYIVGTKEKEITNVSTYNNLLSFNSKHIELQILEKDKEKAISKVKLYKIFPNSILIKIEELKPVFYFENEFGTTVSDKKLQMKRPLVEGKETTNEYVKVLGINLFENSKSKNEIVFLNGLVEQIDEKNFQKLVSSVEISKEEIKIFFRKSEIESIVIDKDFSNLDELNKILIIYNI